MVHQASCRMFNEVGYDEYKLFNSKEEGAAVAKCLGGKIDYISLNGADFSNSVHEQENLLFIIFDCRIPSVIIKIFLIDANFMLALQPPLKP